MNRGVLLGLAVGDALGTTLEFQRPPAVRHVDITGGGPFDVLPGQVTDDTQMACCLARAVKSGHYDREAAIAGYVAWAAIPPFDIGGTTSAAIARLARGDRDAGRAVWQATGRTGAANGSLMRTAPIGVYVIDPDARRAAAFDDSALTHFDPRCQLACAVFDAALAADGDVGAAERELAIAAPALAARHPDLEVATAERELADDLAAARAADPQVNATRDEGFVRTAFRLAFWSVTHATSFADGVIEIVNRGGDADTNGAIAGALLGARFGEDGIPRAWRERVLGCAPPPPYGTLYHPRTLF